MEVFSSRLPRQQPQIKNNLYDIVRSPSHVSVTSTNNVNEKTDYPDFKHRTDKYFEPKKRPKLNVRTIRDIRKEYEKYVYSYLKDDLEKQESQIFKKIECGSARDDNTINIAKKILESDEPKSRLSWLMIIKVNPENKRYPTQYALCDGIKIKLSGSKGGSEKFKWKYDLSQENSCIKKIINYKNQKHVSLLKSSLNCKFKAGPLSKKCDLDRSAQKWAIGKAKLVEMPPISIEIKPEYDVAVEPMIFKYVHDITDESGKITENWANFAVSALGVIVNGTAVQNEKTSNFKFNLKYRNEQKRILMRQEAEQIFDHKTEYVINENKNENDDLQIAAIVEELIRATEISVKENDMYSEQKGSSEADNKNFVNDILMREKSKKKYAELQRLDVTVLKVPNCQNEFCTLGCVCDSLQYKHIKNHCSRVACMFQCTCNFKTQLKTDSINRDEQISNLLNQHDNIRSGLAKEEEKFHQTVLVTQEKSILLKTRRRKAANSYTDFTESLPKRDFTKKNMAINVLRLKCNDIATWCMIHNLYDCFCKGTIVEPCLDIENTCKQNFTANISLLSSEPNSISEVEAAINNETNSKYNTNIYKTRYQNRNGKRPFSIQHKAPDSKLPSDVKLVDEEFIFSGQSNNINDYTKKCARTKPYKRRHFDDDYYSVKNKKIIDMELNDKGLQDKLLKHMKNSRIPTIVTNKSKQIQHVNDSDQKDKNESSSCETNLEIILRRPTIKSKAELISWLEVNYKNYKEKVQSGLKITLEPPKPGKYVLYPWEVILERYRERKNLFLISNTKPPRIFMAVDRTYKCFEDCINIDEIGYSDLHKYPETVQNLLTNAMNVKGKFYILHGHSFCWEIFGHVTKSNKTKVLLQNRGQENDADCTLVDSESSNNSDINRSKFLVSTDSDSSLDNLKYKIKDIVPVNSNTKISVSRWFLMTIEDDFDELQFSIKGFFVKYESIIKAIEVARESKKTVRLSKINKSTDCGDPQFGIYALANMDKLCVFVGPYEEYEELGMKTIKGRRNYDTTKKTRGSWFVIKKIDNFKILENPLPFLHQIESNINKNKELGTNEYSNIKQQISELQTKTNKWHFSVNCTFENQTQSKINVCSNDLKIKETEVAKSSTEPSSNENIKVVKPIKIRKTDAFFPFPNCFESNALKKPAYISSLGNVNNNILLKCISNLKDTEKSLLSNFNNPTNKLQAPKEVSMAVLKPEEINNRLLSSKLLDCVEPVTKNIAQDVDSGTDVENFHKAATKLKDTGSKPDDDILVISDDEENYIDFKPEKWKNVFIECSNIENFGCFRSVMNEERKLSFQFPGFKYSEFYDEKEAFLMLNEVLSRKVYIPKTLKLEWCVVEDKNKLRNNKILQESDKFPPGLILTRNGLCTKSELSSKNREFFRSSFAELRTAVFYVTGEEINNLTKLNKQAETVIRDLKSSGVKLEQERNILQKEVWSKKTKILGNLNVLPENMQMLVKNNLELMDF